MAGCTLANQNATIRSACPMSMAGIGLNSCIFLPNMIIESAHLWLDDVTSFLQSRRSLLLVLLRWKSSGRWFDTNALELLSQSPVCIRRLRVCRDRAMCCSPSSGSRGPKIRREQCLSRLTSKRHATHLHGSSARTKPIRQRQRTVTPPDKFPADENLRHSTDASDVDERILYVLAIRCMHSEMIS